MTDFYNDTNSTEATRDLRNRLHSDTDVTLHALAHNTTDDHLLLIQAIILGQSEVKKRQAIELFIARRVVTALIDAGFDVAVNDGESNTIESSRNVTQITNALMTVDDEHLVVYSTGLNSAIGWVYLVYGNSGWDVVSDYTVNLEDTLRPVFDLIERIEP